MDFSVSNSATRGKQPGEQRDASYDFDALTRWQDSAAGSAVGAQRVRAWVEKGDSSAALDLSQIDLRSCPPLPMDVQDLCLGFNRELDTLPHPLPPALTKLNINFCNFTQLPHDLPIGLLELWLVTNKVVALPDTLPAGLQVLCATNNLIESVPRKLPESLRELYLATNRIAEPDAGLLELPQCTKLLLCNNPISEAGMAMLKEQTGAPGYAGPAVKIGYVGDEVDLSEWIPASRADEMRVGEGPPIIRRAAGNLAAMVNATLRANPGEAVASYADRYKTVIQVLDLRAEPGNSTAGPSNT